MTTPKILIIDGIRMDLSEYLEWRESNSMDQYWDEDYSYPEEENQDD